MSLLRRRFAADKGTVASFRYRGIRVVARRFAFFVWSQRQFWRALASGRTSCGRAERSTERRTGGLGRKVGAEGLPLLVAIGASALAAGDPDLVQCPLRQSWGLGTKPRSRS